jgi:hypothetical protein
MKGTKRKKRDGVWEVRMFVGRDPVTGRPKQISKTVHGGAREPLEQVDHRERAARSARV